MSVLDGIEQVRHLWEDGRSLTEISAALGVSPWRARRLLRTAGVAGAVAVVRCGRCGHEITRGRRGLQGREAALCPACLESLPAAPFAQRLRAYRLAAGLTQEELAERAGLSATSIWQYEQGEALPRGKSLSRLTAVLGDGLHR